MQRRRHVRRLHAGERVALERQAVLVDERAAEARAGREHHHRRRSGAAAHALRLGDAAHVAVVADDQRDWPTGARRQRIAVVLQHVVADEAGRKVRALVHDAVALLRTGDGHADALHLRPPQAVVGEIDRDGLDPAGDDRVGAGLGVGRALQQLGGDRRSVGPDAADLRGRGAAVGADEDVACISHGGWPEHISKTVRCAQRRDQRRRDRGEARGHVPAEGAAADRHGDRQLEHGVRERHGRSRPTAAPMRAPAISRSVTSSITRMPAPGGPSSPDPVEARA